ncbi:GntR family transcriptional regulator [Microbacterium horticulturae]|uniref:GntR family transcriptional regulator n=1 Tax=Microbacterium horticulturae TaxID=3028316 RepID=A0ABY8C009_9MICO|nr:GntR family transcriptional regulator [Microbacterium sp. KACC 23027]WEG09791.1 GntR family transcriptional regulator [Microbacterium sp. KACC 23027]
MADKAVPARAWRVVLEKIETDLAEGTLKPGDHLPPERELAATLGVGRSSVREALRVLDVLGLIRTATGSGPSAGAIVIATPVGGMSALIRLQVAAHGFPIGDVVRTRVILESATAWELGTRFGEARRTRQQAEAAAETLTEPLRLLEAMDAAGLAPAEFSALDAQFHLALAEAAGNAVVVAMMVGLRESIEGYVLEGAERVSDWGETMPRLRAQHREIIDALEHGDPSMARRLVVDHITGYYAHAGLTEEGKDR